MVINLVLGISLIFFPILFYTGFTDPIISKQVLIGIVACITLFLLGIQYIWEKGKKGKHLSILFPLSPFILVLLISALFSLDRADSLISWSWYLFAFLFVWIIYYASRDSGQARMTYLKICLISGITLASILHLLAFFLPAEVLAKASLPKFFSPLGSLIDHVVILTSALVFIAKNFEIENSNLKFKIIYLFVYLIIISNVLLAIYELFFVSKISILPMFMGLHITAYALSHDSGRQIVGFLFGSGPGTFITDFMRFKPSEINLDSKLWSATFVNSSSFFLEILTTTGIIGALSYLFIGGWMINKIVIDKVTFLWSALLIFLSTLILPVSYTTIVIMFVMIGLSVKGKEKINVEIKRGRSLFYHLYSIIFILSSGFLGFYLFRYAYADLLFSQSLRNNNIAQAYQNQLQAIKIFPYRDSFYRTFSQTSLNVGKTFYTKISKKDALVFFQQSISTAKTAAKLAPLYTVNWQNLALVYRSLNLSGADSYAITTTQQALLLDPNNPQEYLNLGGIYYQLGLWNDAVKQFSIAIKLKPDFANAYYNRSRAYQQKGDIKNAVMDYQKATNLKKRIMIKDHSLLLMIFQIPLT